MANTRDNLLYRLRKKGVRVQTREHTIYSAHDGALSQLYRYDDCAENFILVFN